MDKYIYNIDGTFSILKDFYKNIEKFESDITVSTSIEKSGDVIIDGLTMTSSATSNGKGISVTMNLPEDKK